MPETVLRLNPSLIDPSPHNRPTPLAKLGPLIESIRTQKQLQAGRVRHHPTIPGRFECIYGHRRLAVQRFLNGEFLAILHEGELTDAEIIKMQLTENLEREDMSFWEIADAVQQFVLVKKCKQGEAAELLGIDESVVSKAMTVRPSARRWWITATDALRPTFPACIGSRWPRTMCSLFSPARRTRAIQRT